MALAGTQLRDLAFSQATGLLQAGDLLLYRDDLSFKNLVVARGGRSPYSHAGMLDREAGEWRVLEMLQWSGGRSHSLADAVREDAGAWDVWRVDPCHRWPEFDRQRAIAEMRHLVRRPYGWIHLVGVALLHLPVVRFVTPISINDRDADHHPPFCSEAAAIAYRLAGVDPVPNLPDRLTEPGDLARSLFFEYQLTLVPDGLVPCDL